MLEATSLNLIVPLPGNNISDANPGSPDSIASIKLFKRIKTKSLNLNSFSTSNSAFKCHLPYFIVKNQ